MCARDCTHASPDERSRSRSESSNKFFRDAFPTGSNAFASREMRHALLLRAAAASCVLFADGNERFFEDDRTTSSSVSLSELQKITFEIDRERSAIRPISIPSIESLRPDSFVLRCCLLGRRQLARDATLRRPRSFEISGKYQCLVHCYYFYSFVSFINIS